MECRPLTKLSIVQRWYHNEKPMCNRFQTRVRVNEKIHTSIKQFVSEGERKSIANRIKIAHYDEWDEWWKVLTCCERAKKHLVASLNVNSIKIAKVCNNCSRVTTTTKSSMNFLFNFFFWKEKDNNNHSILGSLKLSHTKWRQKLFVA